MAKKSSKASSPSWRTLMRRAKDEDRAGKPKVAASLRKQAAEIRHGRLKPGPKRKTTKRRSKAVHFTVTTGPDGKNAYKRISGAEAKRIAAINHELQFAEMQKAEAKRRVSASAEQQLAEAMKQSTQAPPRLAGIDDANVFVDGLVELARSKDGKAEIMNRLLSLQSVAHYEGERRREDTHTANLKDVQRSIDERIVCGFLAEVGAAQKMHGGLPPGMVWSINSLTVSKISDALVRAGYGPKGCDNVVSSIERCEGLIGKSHIDFDSW